jgi:hypothetical protein
VKQVLKSGDEYDAVSKYTRSVIKWKRKALKKIKRALNKRIRKQPIEGL